MQLSIPNSAWKRCVQCHVYVGGGGGEAVTFLYVFALNMYESIIYYSSPGGLWNHRTCGLQRLSFYFCFFLHGCLPCFILSFTLTSGFYYIDLIRCRSTFESTLIIITPAIILFLASCNSNSGCWGHRGTGIGRRSLRKAGLSASTYIL